MTHTDADDDGATRVALPRVSRLRQRAVALVDQAMELYEQARATVPPVDIAATAVERDNRIGGFLLAGAIAFRFFVYLLPLYLLVLLTAGAALSFAPTALPSSVRPLACRSTWRARSATPPRPRRTASGSSLPSPCGLC